MTRLGVDVGGTFTDVVLLAGDALVTAKVPTTADQSVGVVRGVEKACAEAGIEPGEIESFTHATTVSVNALLEGAGAETALVTTAGFRDVLEIGRQARPDLYDLDATKPEPLVPRRRRFELDERATVEGIERRVDDEEIREVAGHIRGSDAESVAVSLLHAYAHPENERRVAELLREELAELDVPVSASHETLAEFREYERTSTTAVDAYVTPPIRDYVGRLVDRAADLDLPTPRIMQANGGIAAAETVRNHAVTTVLSGPAAGVVGAASAVGGARSGDGSESESGDGNGDGRRDDDDARRGLVTFDMGGTSADVSLVRGGAAERTTDAEVGGYPVKTPMVDVNTVGAGGGSVAWVDAGGALRVGPRSAGADPGPACYGRGGTEPTVTDANVALGYIGEEAALGGELSLDATAARDALAGLAEEAGLDGPLEAARGVYRVATANMARAVRAVTVERGHDPRRFALVAFGGAGPMHAAALAADLDVGRVVVPRACGVLSAYGLLSADEKHDAVRTLRTPVADLDGGAVGDAFGALAEETLADCSDPEAATVERAADLRYVGQSFELTVPVALPFDPGAVTEAFHDAHESTYGYRTDDPVELVNVRATATVERDPVDVRYGGGADPAAESREASFGGGFRETPVYVRERVPAGESVSGPAVFEGEESTVVVPPEWDTTVDDRGALVLTRGGEGA